MLLGDWEIDDNGTIKHVGRICSHPTSCSRWRQVVVAGARDQMRLMRVDPIHLCVFDGYSFEIRIPDLVCVVSSIIVDNLAANQKTLWAKGTNESR